MNVRKRRWLLPAMVIVLASGMIVVGGRWPRGSLDAHEVRTIEMTAKDMKFNTTNPTITLEPGESIRLIVRNEDPGMKHELTIPDLGIESPVLMAGEEAVLEFRAPQQGKIRYLCSFHPFSMNGVFFVEDAKGWALNEGEKAAP